MTYCYYNAYDEEVCDDSSWDGWGRWVLAGVLIGVFVLTVVSFVTFSCITSRRRRAKGIKPYPMTSWAAPPAYSPEDPHPEGKELAESPAPSYQAATTQRGATRQSVQDGTEVQDGMNTTRTPSGDHGVQALTVPGRVADPEANRDHGDVV